MQMDPEMSPVRERRRGKRWRETLANAVDPNRFEADCLQLEQELEDLEKAFKADYFRRHWFTGIRIFISPPIHSS